VRFPPSTIKNKKRVMADLQRGHADANEMMWLSPVMQEDDRQTIEHHRPGLAKSHDADAVKVADWLLRNLARSGIREPAGDPDLLVARKILEDYFFRHLELSQGIRSAVARGSRRHPGDIRPSDFFDCADLFVPLLESRARRLGMSLADYARALAQ